MMNSLAKIICIIPARGGSKGIPRKNIQILAGKPLLAHSILHARNTPSISRIIVSTDDQQIAQIASAYGAEIILRPDEISGDTATSESALVHVLDELEKKENYVPDLVVFLQATSPCRQDDDIQKAIDLLIAKDADSLLSVGEIHGFVWSIDREIPTPIHYDPLHRPRRQELTEHMVEENGSIYLFRPWVLRKYNSRLGGRIVVYKMRNLDSFQVDEPQDLDLVEKVLYHWIPAGLQPLFFGNKELTELFQGLQLLALDFDGVLTDNKVLVTQDGKEAVYCHRGDGFGIVCLKQTGVHIEVFSTEENPVVTSRCMKLGIPCIQGSINKLEALQKRANELGVTREQIAFVGNDDNDLGCLGWVGVPIAVADASKPVLKIAKLITKNNGGQGAVREVIDWILQAKGMGSGRK